MSGEAARYIILVSVTMAGAFAQSPGRFMATGSMTAARQGQTAALLTDGRVLLAGGTTDRSAEIYDPSTDTFAATGSMTSPRIWAGSALLPDGRVLIVGGSPWSAAASAETYEPASGSFTAAGNLTFPRIRPTAILLASGKVLIIGGVGMFGADVQTAELYDPATSKFTPTASFSGKMGCDFCAPSVLLADGRTLFSATNPAQLYDPASEGFTWTGAQPYEAFGFADYHNAATLLINGTVLLAGGEDDLGRKSSAEVYDPSSGVFYATGQMSWRRSSPSLTLLPDGSALAAGGETDGCNPGFCFFAGTLATAELYDPTLGTFSATANMTTSRESHTATLLNDGRVLLAGGVAYGGINIYLGELASAEIYTPLALIPAPRLFSVSGNDTGQGAIWHSETGQLVSAGAPALAGEALSMYTTSLTQGGAIPPRVFVGGRFAEVLYFGDAPGYKGFNQVNIRLPDGIPSGSQIPVRLSYLDRSSNQVTIAVQ